MPQLDDIQTGKQVSVSDAEMPFVAAPGARLQLPASVMIVSPDGDVFAAPGNDPKVRQALGMGWRIESPEETQHREAVKKYGNQEIRTALEGAASGVTLGLSDVAQTKLGIATPEELAGRREANPTAYNVGQIGGIAASLLVPGAAPGALIRGAEATAIGKIAGAAARTATAPLRAAEYLSAQAGKAAAEAVLPIASGSGAMARALASGTKLGTQGIVDGAIFGTGQLVSEHALGDTDINAERVLSHIGMSALIGGALGGGLGGIVGVASPAASAARAKLLENIEKIPGINRESIAEELKTQSQKAALASVSALGGLISKLKKQGLSELGPEAMFELKAPDGKSIIQGFRDAHQIAQRLDDTAEMLGRDIGAKIDSLDAAGINAGVTPQEIAETLKKDLLASYKGQIGAKEASNYVKREIKQLLEMGEAGPPGLRIDQEAGFVKTPGEMQYQPVSNRWLQDMRQRMSSGYEQDKVSDEARREIERVLNSYLEKSLEKNLSAESFQEYMQAKKGFRSIAAIQKATGNRVATLEGNRYFSLSDRLTSGATQAMYGGLNGGIEGAMGALPLTQGALLGLGAAAVARQMRTRGASALAVFLNKASKMMAVEKAVKSAAESESEMINKAVASMFGGRQSAKMADIINRPLVKKQAEDILRMMSDPDATSKIRTEIETGLGDIAPEIARGMADKVVSGLSFLASKAPRDESSAMTGLTPNAARKWEPSAAQSLSYARYVDAVNNPAKVVSDLAGGAINHEGMEVLQTLYPAMKREITLKFIEKMAVSKKPLPYQKRVALGLLLGVPNADPTLLPQYVAEMQSGFKKQQTQTQEQQPITNNASKSLGKALQQNMTQTDRLAGGQEL